MQIEPLIKHRPEEYAYCSHCNTRQKQPSGLSPLEYFFHQKYLDDGLVDVEEKYFNEKYITCSECGNVCEMFSEDNTQHLQNENIKSIISSSISRIEKNLLIMHIIKNDEESLLDLYNYYQYIKNKEKETEYREKLITYYTSIYKQDNDIHSFRMLIELYRRNKDFAIALKLIKESKYANVGFVTNDTKGIIAKELKAIEKEQKLCKAKNSEREQLDIKQQPKYNINDRVL